MPSSHLTDELNGPQWFDATKFPNATFVSTSIKMRGQNDATIHGNLTLHGVTSPVSVQAACVLLERFVERGLVVDVTRRSARRLFAQKYLAPLRENVEKSRKPLHGRKPARLRGDKIITHKEDERIENVTSPALPRWQFDFSELEAAMVALDSLCGSTVF